MLEISDVDGCRSWLDLGDDAPAAAFRSLDLSDTAGFESGRFDGCLFLSCELTPAQAGYLTITGATVIRDDDVRPFTAHRPALYTPDEIFDGYDPNATDGYATTFDRRVYEHWQATGRQYPSSIAESLARRLHDHSISEALHDELAGQRPVAIMGGHGLERGDPAYATAAAIARRLTREGLLVLSGGGPGAMEAAHLGAYLAGHGDGELDAAIKVLSPRPSGAEAGREYADPDWLHRAMLVRERWPIGPDTGDSIAIPTWMYGHEPPSAFATKLAKYFANDVREEGLLAVATHGVVFTPGSAGTIQEIFQDAAQNHYASFGPPSPMVLFDTDYWTNRHPVWPLLTSLADRHDYHNLITITDDPDEAVAALVNHERPGPGPVRQRQKSSVDPSRLSRQIYR